MKARIHYVCLPKTKVADYEAENIELDVDLPFVPPIGTMLKVTAGGDYLRVEDVYLDIVPNGDGLAIYIEEPDEITDLRPWKEMKSEGWNISEN